MTTFAKPFDVSKELATLRHEKKNQDLKRLPPNATIQRRPLHHAPIPSPHVGAHVQKVVYVSRRTPVMSAVKRVKKLLRHIEKRALQDVDMKHSNHAQTMAKLADVSDKLAKTSEEVLVKASGRAMEQALRVGEWFRTREDELTCNVEVRTGNVVAVDDIVELENHIDDEEDSSMESDQRPGMESTLDGGETTMELLGHKPTESTILSSLEGSGSKEADSDHGPKPADTTKRRRRKRKRATHDKDDLPEARIRWVKTVEIAISLKA